MILKSQLNSHSMVKNIKGKEFQRYQMQRRQRISTLGKKTNGELFEYIKGDKDSIMGLPIKQIKAYIKNYKK